MKIWRRLRIARRVAVFSQLRVFLLERGIVFARTPAKLRMAIPENPGESVNGKTVSLPPGWGI